MGQVVSAIWLLGLWIFNKQIVLPVERSWAITMQNESTSLVLVEAEAESLPQYDDSILLDSAYEEQLEEFITPRLESAYRRSDCY